MVVIRRIKLFNFVLFLTLHSVLVISQHHAKIDDVDDSQHNYIDSKCTHIMLVYKLLQRKSISNGKPK